MSTPGEALAEAIDSIEPPTEEAPAEPETTEEEQTEAEAAPEGEGEPEKGEKKAKDPEEDFSDERPWTPERVKKAAEAAKELTSKAHKLWAQAERRASKLEAKIGEWKKERDTVMAVRDQISGDLKALRSGDPAAVIDALGRLTQTDGTKLYTDLSLYMAKGGKGKDEAAELRAELEAIKAERMAEKEAARFSSNVQTARRAILDHVQMDDKWPTVAKMVAKVGAAEVATEIEEYIAENYPKGVAVDFQRILRHDLPSALNSAELYLREHPELWQPDADEGKATTTSGVDAGPETRADDANPGQARRTPGRSISPSIATASAASKRVLTREERLQELGNDPDFWKSLGI